MTNIRAANMKNRAGKSVDTTCSFFPCSSCKLVHYLQPQLPAFFLLNQPYLLLRRDSFTATQNFGWFAQTQFSNKVAPAKILYNSYNYLIVIKGNFMAASTSNAPLSSAKAKTQSERWAWVSQFLFSRHLLAEMLPKGTGNEYWKIAYSAHSAFYPIYPLFVSHIFELVLVLVKKKSQ